MNQTKQIIEEIAEINDKALYPTGFEDAIIGYVERFGLEPLILVDRDKVLDIMVKRDGMTRDEAIEYFEYNVIGAWMGDGTPCFATILRTGDVKSKTRIKNKKKKCLTTSH